MQAVGDLLEKGSFGLIVPIGLLHRAPRLTERLLYGPGRIGTLSAGALVLVLMNLLRVQVWEHAVADVLQDQRFTTIANDDPVAGPDLHFVHEPTPSSLRDPG